MTGQRKLHILMTTDAVGGVWQYALTLAQGLCAEGHRVTLALLGPEASSEKKQQAEKIPGLRLVETGLSLDWVTQEPGPTVRAARALRQLAAEVKADLVHCNSPVLVAEAKFPVPVIAVAHGCVTTWWQAARKGALAREYHWHEQMTAAGLRAADAVVAPSASFARTLQSTYSLKHLPLTVHNGRSPAEGTPQGPQLDIGLTAGRLWDPVKGGDTLDRAAAQVSAPILAAGALRGPQGEEFSPGRLQALGQLHEDGLRGLLNLKPVFLSAARFEPFGLAVLEAASAGCALVLADIPTFRELWDEAAEFVPADDADAYAAALRSLLANRPRRDALGAAARQRSLRYTPAATTAAMMRLYDRVLAPQEVAA